MHHRFNLYVLVIFEITFVPLGLISSPLPNNELGNGLTNFEPVRCDPLHAQGTAVLCFPPTNDSTHNVKDLAQNCSQPSIPGTIASYACRNFRGDVFNGFMDCSLSGFWIISLTHANNSLCNLDASIINFEVPDIVVATDLPAFTTPFPNQELLQHDISFLNDYEKVALQLHNVFRKNHGVPFVIMTKQLNTIAQRLLDSITLGNDAIDIGSEFKLDALTTTINIEMNWYFQGPSSLDGVDAVSNAVQMWYSGFFKYDWDNIGNNLDFNDALAFSRVVWKNTKFIGVGIHHFQNFTFVACIYSPGRNILNTDPINEFSQNVLKIVVG